MTTGMEPHRRRQLRGQAWLPLLAVARRGYSGRGPPENVDGLAARVAQAEDEGAVLVCCLPQHCPFGIYV
jgi:hypothetical protein